MSQQQACPAMKSCVTRSRGEVCPRNGQDRKVKQKLPTLGSPQKVRGESKAGKGRNPGTGTLVVDAWFGTG
jgi:hypothetical protein